MNYKTVFENAKKIETLLEKLGATGNGIRTKADSISSELSPQLYRKIKRIGAIRNKIVHGEGYDEIPNEFDTFVKSSIEELEKMLISNKESDEDIYKVLVPKFKKLENSLKELGAEGKSLHEKIDSIEFKIDIQLKNKLRYIATVRNKLMHEFGYDIENVDAFIKDIDLVIEELDTSFYDESISSEEKKHVPSLLDKLKKYFKISFYFSFSIFLIMNFMQWFRGAVILVEEFFITGIKDFLIPLTIVLFIILSIVGFIKSIVFNKKSKNSSKVSEKKHILSERIEYLPEFADPNNESYFSQTEQYELFLKKYSLMTKEQEDQFSKIKKSEKKAFFYFKVGFFIFLLVFIQGLYQDAPIPDILGFSIPCSILPFAIGIFHLIRFQFDFYTLDKYIYNVFLTKKIKILYFFEEVQEYKYEELETLHRRLYIRKQPNTILIYCSFDAFLKGADGFIILNRDKGINKEEIEIVLIKNIRRKN